MFNVVNPVLNKYYLKKNEKWVLKREVTYYGQTRDEGPTWDGRLLSCGSSSGWHTVEPAHNASVGIRFELALEAGARLYQV